MEIKGWTLQKYGKTFKITKYRKYLNQRSVDWSNQASANNNLVFSIAAYLHWKVGQTHCSQVYIIIPSLHCSLLLTSDGIHHQWLHHSHLIITATNDPGLPDSPDRSDLAVGASGWGCIKCQSGVCHLDKDQSLTVDSWSFVCSSRCTAALVVLLSVC